MHDRRVLLVAREGMDWQVAGPLADAGLLPALSSQLDRGTHGALAGIAPQLAAMHATSMATGCWPHEHGIISQTLNDPATGLPLDFPNGGRRVPAFWNILSACGLRHHVIGWPASHPAEPVEGVHVSERWMQVPLQAGAEWPLPDGAVQPASLAGRLAGCRARLEEIDLRLLGLFFPHAAEMDLARDPLALRLVQHLARLYTTHNTAMALLEDEQEAGRPWRAFTVFDSFLESVGQDFFKFRGAAADTTARDQGWYGAVVDGAYRLHDALLGEMMAMAGNDVTLMLVADRGFKLRQPAGSAHSLIGGPAHPPGMAVVAGPGILPAGSLHPASVLDVTPTLLHLLDLPVGRDMAGRPWIELESTPRPSEKIDSWGPQCPGFEAARTAPAESAADLWGSEGAREHHLNLGLCLVAAGRPAKAVGPLYQAMAARPEDPLAGHHLALALITCGLKQEAMNALAPLFDLGEDDLHLRQHLASLAIQCDDGATASRLLEHPANIDPDSGELRPAFTLLRGLAALHQGNPGLAESCCRSALESDPERPEAWLGLARCLLARDEFGEAETAARRAFAISGSDPLACLILAQCAAQRGDSAAAATFAAEALHQQPDLQHPRDILRKFFPAASPAVREQVTGLLQQARPSSPLHGKHRAEARAELERARKATATARATLRKDAQPLHLYHIPT
ncbi:MAG: alkaline phosphatase family protein [Verrucomicrobiota bacterium]